MKISYLRHLLEQLPGDLEIYIAVFRQDEEGDATGRIKIEPVCESCEDDTIIGYMITDQGDEDVH